MKKAIIALLAFAAVLIIKNQFRSEDSGNKEDSIAENRSSFQFFNKLNPWTAKSVESSPLPNSTSDASKSQADQLEIEIHDQLQEIKDRRLVEVINDPRSHRNEKEDALQFLNEYLNKVTLYLKLRNQELQIKLGISNG